MARNISVKVPTAKLVEMIEARIAEIDKAISEYPAKREQFEKDQEAYKAKVAEFLTNYLTKNSSMVGYDHDSVVRISRSYNGRFEVTIDTQAVAGFPVEPKCPEQPNQREWFGRDHATRRDLLAKNLRILKMTSQEEVSATTYGAVMEII